MNDSLHHPVHPVRVVTAASLFDGHDASITIMRRILQAQGCEVIHLGHDRSVEEVVEAALQEDAQGVAVSSYQGGHLEYFGYLVEALRERGAGHVQVFGGGGGVIVPAEIAALAARGVRIFSPQDGQRLGLAGMVNTMVAACDVDLAALPPRRDAVLTGDQAGLARAVTVLENGRGSAELVSALRSAAACRTVPVLGVTGTGGSGKSSLTDELVRRLRIDQHDKLRIAVLAVDPTRRRSGGALLGDRIRMNALGGGRTFFRSLATRGAAGELPDHLDDVVTAVKAAGYDLVIVETPGIGQGDAGIAGRVDVALYVMTPEFGAAGQLEKIDMLDVADAVAVNKVERRGGDDALRDVGRQLVRNRGEFGRPWQDQPVFGTSAARFDDDGVTALYQYLRDLLAAKGLPVAAGALAASASARRSSGSASIVPSARVRYLAEIAETVRGHHRRTDQLAEAARRREHLSTAIDALAEAGADDDPGEGGRSVPALRRLRDRADAELDPATRQALADWPATLVRYCGDELAYQVRGRELRVPLRRQTLSGTSVPRVALPRIGSAAELVRFVRSEHLPGEFPYTAGVFPLSRDEEAPARMFAGEGDPARTNRRFHLLSAGQPATRLSTAFDSVTLYGRDPDPRPDVYGKVGTSGVSVATLDDMRDLFAGFDLCSPTTSVSMTDQRPGAHHLGNVPQRGDRPAGRGLRGRAPPQPRRRRALRVARPHPGHGARHRAGRHPQGGPGPEHLHLLDRVRTAVHGRRPAVLHRQRGAQLLLGVHQRLPHRRGRGEPRQPAGLHPGQCLHLRRGLPGEGHGGRRLRPEPVVLLQQRDGRRVHRHRPGGAADLGGRDAGSLRGGGASRRS